MTTRTFRAPNMLAALQAVQQELGPEALVVSVRQVQDGPAWQVWRGKGVEVVAMPPAGFPPAGPPGAATALKSPTASISNAAALAAEIARLKARRGDRSAPARSASGSTTLSAYRQRLITQGVEAALVDDILAVCAQTLGPQGLIEDRRVRAFLQGQLAARLRTRGEALLSAHRTICLIGARGSGKTSIAAKLAAQRARSARQQVVWICADTHHAGAIAEARAFSEPLGANLRLAYTPQELAQQAAECGEADLILVDTPGCNPLREDEVAEVGGYLSALSNRAIYLMAAATCKETDLHQMLAAFAPFRPDGAVATHLDETTSFGALFNFLRRSRLPLLYTSRGPEALHGLQAGRSGALARALLEGSWKS